MIVLGLLELVYGLFLILTAPISLPSLPEPAVFVITSVIGYIETGLQILACYVNLDFLLILFGLVVAVDAGLLIYKFVMWVLRKIPMLGIS